MNPGEGAIRCADIFFFFLFHSGHQVRTFYLTAPAQNCMCTTAGYKDCLSHTVLYTGPGLDFIRIHSPCVTDAPFCVWFLQYVLSWVHVCPKARSAHGHQCMPFITLHLFQKVALKLTNMTFNTFTRQHSLIS